MSSPYPAPALKSPAAIYAHPMPTPPTPLTPPGLPAELQELFSDQDPNRTLSVPLPPGRLVRGDEGDDDQPALWVSDAPITPQLWQSLRAERPRSGLTPLLLDHLDGDASRPWDAGELWPGDMTEAGDHDPGVLLAEWWDEYTDYDEESDDLTRAERLAVTAPFGRQWPGLLAGKAWSVDPDAHADLCAARFQRSKPHLRLGLVAAERGSDAIAVAGWSGAVNYANDAAELSAVLRSWEDRFGARVIGVGFAELHVSVAAPPATHEEAQAMAAEHFAFCPDNVWMTSLLSYAEEIVGQPVWDFWWD